MVRLARRLAWGGACLALLSLAGAAGATWLSRHWLRAEGEKLLLLELARQNVHLEYGRASFVFDRGLVLEEVHLYETGLRDTLLLSCTELGFNFDAWEYARNRFRGEVRSTFTTQGATVTCYDGGEVVAVLEDLSSLICLKPGLVAVEWFRGRLGGLDFDLDGEILQGVPSEASLPGSWVLEMARTSDRETRKVADFTFFRDLMPWLAVAGNGEGVRPVIRASFQVDGGSEHPVAVTGRFIGRDFHWREVPVDSASVEFAFAEGDERLLLRDFHLIYEGGIIAGAGEWDSGSNQAEVRRFQSSADLISLVRRIKPEAAPFAASVEKDDPPLIKAVGRLDLNEFWNSDLILRYRHASGMNFQLGETRLRVEGIDGELHVGRGGIRADSLLATVYGGNVEMSGEAFLAGEEPVFQGRLSTRGIPLRALAAEMGSSQDLPGILSGEFEGGGGLALGSLNGRGSLRVDGARLYRVPVLGPVQHLMGSVIPVFGDQEKRSELTATFEVRQGVLASRDLVAIADGTRVTVEGTLDLADLETRFEARGNLVGALGLVTGLVSKAMVVEGSGPVDDLEMNLKHVPLEFASETVKGVFQAAGHGAGLVGGAVGAGLDGAQQVAGGAAKVVGGGARLLGGGLRLILPGSRREPERSGAE